MDQTFSRPIHREGSAGSGWILQRSTRMIAFSIRPQDGDVIVKFRDGAGGQILWESEADNAAGSHSESFGSYPLLFKNGIYVDVVDDSGKTNWDISIAVIEPQSSGT
jgi:hypothetical protein